MRQQVYQDEVGRAVNRAEEKEENCTSQHTSCRAGSKYGIEHEDDISVLPRSTKSEGEA